MLKFPDSLGENILKCGFQRDFKLWNGNKTFAGDGAPSSTVATERPVTCGFQQLNAYMAVSNISRSQSNFI